MNRIASGNPPESRQSPGLALLDQLHLDRALLAAYAVCCAIELVLLPLDGHITWAEVGPAMVLQAAIFGLLALGARLPEDRGGTVAVLGITGYLLSVALLRDGTEPTAGYGPLVLLPVVWASLRGRRVELTVSVVGVALVYILPALLIGPPQYPAGAWRAGLLFVVLSTVLGLSVRQLVGHVGRLVAQLAGLARTDELTGLPNRRAWREFLEHELTIARRTGQELTVAMFDLDHFKSYNDTHGHLAGDRLLLHASSAWHSALRETDRLTRWGGDEFGLLLPGCNSRQAEKLVTRIRAAYPGVQFSVGLAEWDRTSSSDALVAAADEALYRDKQGKALAGSAVAQPA